MSRYPHAATVREVRAIPARGLYPAGVEVALEVTGTAAARLRAARPATARVGVEGLSLPAWVIHVGQGDPLPLKLLLMPAREAPTATADREAGLLHGLRSGAVQALQLAGSA